MNGRPIRTRERRIAAGLQRQQRLLIIKHKERDMKKLLMTMMITMILALGSCLTPRTVVIERAPRQAPYGYYYQEAPRPIQHGYYNYIPQPQPYRYHRYASRHKVRIHNNGYRKIKKSSCRRGMGPNKTIRRGSSQRRSIKQKPRKPSSRRSRRR